MADKPTVIKHVVTVLFIRGVVGKQNVRFCFRNALGFALFGNLPMSWLGAPLDFMQVISPLTSILVSFSCAYVADVVAKIRIAATRKKDISDLLFDSVIIIRVW